MSVWLAGCWDHVAGAVSVCAGSIQLITNSLQSACVSLVRPSLQHIPWVSTGDPSGVGFVKVICLFVALEVARIFVKKF